MISMAALLLLAVSCKKDKEQQIDGSGFGFRATVESHEGDSKTHLDGVAVKWDSNDEILVQSNTCPEGKRFVLVYEEGDEAGFNPDETLPEGFYSPNYTAYYPAGMMQTGTFTLPAIQTYKANSFGNGANPMIAACGDKKMLAFKNICGLLKLQLYSETACQVRSITLISHKKNELLCGTGTVEWNDGKPTLSLASGDGSLTLDCGAEGLVMSTGEANPSVFYFVVPAGTLSEGFTVKVMDMDGTYWIKAAKASTDNTIARSKIKPMPTQKIACCTIPEGALPGLFSVGSGRKVYFSQGNLQYLAKGGPADDASATAEYGQSVGGTWRFAEHQSDIIGQNNLNASPTYEGWIDLFAWGTSGYNHGASCYQPWSMDANKSSYSAYGNNDYHLYSQTPATADWGYNAIQNGEGSNWRTLSNENGQGELHYLFNGRPDANQLYGEGCVDGVNGLIILPDNWTLPVGLTFTSGAIGWSNVYSYSEWAKMEAAGAVFLPAAGRRDSAISASHPEITVDKVNERCYYASSSSCPVLEQDNDCYYLRVENDAIYPDQNFGYRYHAFSVRLVTNAD